jgi:8-oxo-dGTP pyrophosphatase MutT (NUDIX family)
MTSDTEHAPDAIPAATVVLGRDGSAGIEVLMLHRSPALRFAADLWVFPGGRVDPADLGVSTLDAARRAAVRETQEEAGLDVTGDSLVPWMRWSPPPEAPRRFSTFFFLGRAPDGQVTVDGGEIDDHQWVSPAIALERRDGGVMEMLPPTWMVLHVLSHHTSVAEAIGTIGSQPISVYETKMVHSAAGLLAVYDGDVAYGGGDPEAPGPRRRINMFDIWSFEGPW